MGAAAFNVTVPVLVAPSRTEAGLKLTLDGVGVVAAPVVTVSTADRDTPPAVAVIVAELFALTVLVVMVNVALVDPPATATLGGTAAVAVLLLDSTTVWPPEGAAELSVTIPVADEPPTTDVGLMLRLARPAVAGDDVTVQPDKRAFVGLADPSLTSTVQSAGLV